VLGVEEVNKEHQLNKVSNEESNVARDLHAGVYNIQENI